MKKIVVNSIIDDMDNSFNALGKYSFVGKVFGLEFWADEKNSGTNANIRINGSEATVASYGEINTKLKLVKNESTLNLISTQYGDIEVTAFASVVQLSENESNFVIELKYNLLQGEIEFSRCATTISIDK